MKQVSGGSTILGNKAEQQHPKTTSGLVLGCVESALTSGLVKVGVIVSSSIYVLRQRPNPITTLATSVSDSQRALLDTRL